MVDLEVLYLIRDEMLTNPNNNAEDVYLLANIAQEDAVMYSLMNKWMEQVDPEEREYLFHDMLHRRDQLFAKVIPIKRTS